MTHKPPVHVELREKGWAVIREGNERATSAYPTQSEAAREGREIARREQTEFFLHAQDGRVREHRSYGEGSRSTGKGVVGQAAEAVTGGVSAVAQALGPTREAGADAGREANRSGGTTDAGSDDGASGDETNDTEEAHGMTDARTPEERYAGYEVYDRDGERIGRPDYLFVDENDNLEYVGVRIDPLGAGAALIPADVVTVDDGLRRMVVSQPKGVVEEGPRLEQDEELSPGLEERVRVHYGLLSPQGVEDRGGYGAYYPGDDAELAHGERTGDPDVEVPGARGAVPSGLGRVHDRSDPLEPGGVIDEEDDLRVRRSEEELRVGTREREAGVVRVRKRVRTERERIVVPKKRVEVRVERVRVEGEASGSEIGEDEIVVPLTEEEVVVEKRPVVKEEIRIRKEVVEEAEVVEEDLRREEVEVEDQTERRDG